MVPGKPVAARGLVNGWLALAPDGMERSGRRGLGAGRRVHPRTRQREGPDGYKLSRSDDAVDVGRDGVSKANGTFRSQPPPERDREENRRCGGLELFEAVGDGD